MIALQCTEYPQQTLDNPPIYWASLNVLHYRPSMYSWQPPMYWTHIILGDIWIMKLYAKVSGLLSTCSPNFIFICGAHYNQKQWFWGDKLYVNFSEQALYSWFVITSSKFKLTFVSMKVLLWVANPGFDVLLKFDVDSSKMLMLRPIRLWEIFMGWCDEASLLRNFLSWSFATLTLLSLNVLNQKS